MKWFHSIFKTILGMFLFVFDRKFRGLVLKKLNSHRSPDDDVQTREEVVVILRRVL